MVRADFLGGGAAISLDAGGGGDLACSTCTVLALEGNGGDFDFSTCAVLVLDGKGGGGASFWL